MMKTGTNCWASTRHVDEFVPNFAQRGTSHVICGSPSSFSRARGLHGRSFGAGLGDDALRLRCFVCCGATMRRRRRRMGWQMIVMIVMLVVVEELEKHYETLWNMFGWGRMLALGTEQPCSLWCSAPRFSRWGLGFCRILKWPWWIKHYSGTSQSNLQLDRFKLIFGISLEWFDPQPIDEMYRQETETIFCGSESRGFDIEETSLWW